MNTEAATQKISKTLVKLEQAIGEPVFDEWALVTKVPTGWNLLQYGGTRKEEFLSAFKEDVAALQDTLDLNNPLIGDFAFSHDGHGTGFDAHMCVGARAYVLFNNTGKNTDEITANPKWKSAQIHFATLLDAFIVDPMMV